MLVFRCHYTVSGLGPPHNRDGRRVHHSHQPDNHHQNITRLRKVAIGNTLQVKVRRVDIHQRHARHTTDESNKLVQIARTDNGNETRKQHNARAERILLPLGEHILLPGALPEELLLQDTYRGEQLHGLADHDGNRVQELYRVDELARLREVGDDLDADIFAKGAVAEDTDGAEDDGDDEHDEGEELVEVLRVLHAGLDGEDEADAFEGEDCGADGQCEVPGVEELDGGVEAVHLGDARDVVPVDVDETHGDENVGEDG